MLNLLILGILSAVILYLFRLVEGKKTSHSESLDTTNIATSAINDSTVERQAKQVVVMNSLQKIEVICAIGLFISFFLPWGKLFSFTGSGYDLAANFGGEAKFAWLIPLSSIVVIVVAFYEHGTNTNDFGKTYSIIAGALPFIGLLYGLFQIGKDLFEVLAIGAYLSLMIGLILILSGLGVFNSLSPDKNP